MTYPSHCHLCSWRRQWARCVILTLWHFNAVGSLHFSRISVSLIIFTDDSTVSYDLNALKTVFQGVCKQPPNWLLIDLLLYSGCLRSILDKPIILNVIILSTTTQKHRNCWKWPNDEIICPKEMKKDMYSYTRNSS